jgi:ligand-binding sensor domain-containing protein
MPKRFKLIPLILLCIVGCNSMANPIKISRVITVADGLPQSFVSGVMQDDNGFIWTATLNGLGRYDGRVFKRYQHTLADPDGMSENIILNLYNAGNNNIWLCYGDGKIDEFNTVTEKVVHLWQQKGFDKLLIETTNFKSLISDNGGKYWMMAIGGGVYCINRNNNTIIHLSPAQLKLNQAVLGIAVINKRLALLTASHLAMMDGNYNIAQSIPYPFKSINQFKNETTIYSPALRANGDLIITDAAGIKIWNIKTKFYKAVPLPRVTTPGKVVAQLDGRGNYYSEYRGGLVRLDNNNQVTTIVDTQIKGLPVSFCMDKSGVIWLGTNGFGLRQYNFSNTGLPGYTNQYSFTIDVLLQYGAPSRQLFKTFLPNSAQFANRNVTIGDSVWVVDIYLKSRQPQLVLYTHNALSVKKFTNSGAAAGAGPISIKFLAKDSKGKLWGIDSQFRLLKFNLHQGTFTLYKKVNIPAGEEINGMAADGDAWFYISTNKSLVKVNAAKGVTQNISAFLPNSDLLSISNDPVDKNTLWVGTLSDGLIKLNKSAKTTKVFSMAAGLPNNTIYSILPGNDGMLWCSSNRGVFAFDRVNNTSRSYTSADGLTDDEFNRYYYLVLPDGSLAFGGPQGYTIFNPAKLKTDNFEPRILLTSLDVINRPGVKVPLSGVRELKLNYDQNFITAGFAAMQFDIPQKLQYRYMLKGLDKNWVVTGNENKVSYTSLPPGNYTLMLNASNTAGKWSTYTRQIRVIILPPFWQTWLFYLLAAILTVNVFYFLLNFRIKGIKKVQAQKLKFEREAAKLHALALRARMNPHFIFNCLNSIKALIQESETNKAVSYLTSFSVLIRKQLNNNSNEISLRDELDTCKLYLHLEAMRFEGEISYHFNIQEDEMLLETMVPPLILQPVIENAIAHGLLPSPNGGTVEINVYREGEYGVCVVRDNGIGRAAARVNKQNSNSLHQSQGVKLLEERIMLHNRITERVSSMQTIDLHHPGGAAAGTLVIIKFNIDYD